MNLIAGFISIICAVNGEILIASWLILTAMIFDFLDGFSARLLKAYSDLGKELDSLADQVSFGVAPAIVLYELITTSDRGSSELFSSGTLNPQGVLMLIPVIMMPVCAGLRLAKFNIDTTQTTSFKGLPTPANALAVISLVFAARFTTQPFFDNLAGSPVALSVISVVLSILMVTRIPLLSLKTTSLKLKGNEGRYLLAGLVLISLLVFGAGGIALIIPVYIIASLVSRLF